MTIELMDGATGSKHISSEDWTVFNEATYGASEAVFDWGNKFKLTMSTANAGTLATGAGLVDGKRVWIKSPESITVTSGSQGMKRNDIVGIQYETYTSNGATLERPVVEVIKGTPNATTAADPSIPDKFLALWRVPLDGISVGTPVALFDVMESIKGFRDSVSLEVDLVPGVSPYHSNTPPTVTRVGDVVMLEGALTPNSDIGDGYSESLICRIPEGFRPVKMHHSVHQGSQANRWHMSVYESGDVYASRYGTTSIGALKKGAWLVFSATWLSDDARPKE